MNQTESNDPSAQGATRASGDDAAEAVGRDDNDAGGAPEDLREALEAALARADDERDSALRMQAELENYRRRAAREMENARRFALERFMGDLLDVRDSLERGLEAGQEESASVTQLIEGTDLTFRMLEKVLTSHGLTTIDPLGEPFDPERHEAMTVVPSAEHAPDTVVNVVQKGYLLNDRLLRPARVLVAGSLG